MFKDVNLATHKPKLVVWSVLLLTLLAIVPFTGIKIDTDPENMLAADNPARVFHHQTKERFGLSDMLVLGVINPDGIDNQQSLERINVITEAILKVPGVVRDDVLSFKTTDNIESDGGMLKVGRIMDEVPKDPARLEAIIASIESNDFLVDKLLSHDRQGIAIYIPIEDKSLSHDISLQIAAIVEQNSSAEGKEQFHLAGLPIAEDTFGHDMFIQMAISAPAAGLVLFILMWVFFKRIKLITPPMLLALSAVIITMGALIAAGNTVHIMSSMIPIFLMPIAVVDSIHILSDFYERFEEFGNKADTLRAVIGELFTPMLYTSLTSAVGFASLALTPIPPVQIFGLFIALGILIAWVLTMVFLPAYLMLIDTDQAMEQVHAVTDTGEDNAVARALVRLGRFATVRNKAILATTFMLMMVAGFGISKIVVNDNPVRWFKEGTLIRDADTAMNKHFGGTYMAYLVLEGASDGSMKSPEMVAYIDKLQQLIGGIEDVGKTSSFVDILKRVNYILHDLDPKFLTVPTTVEQVGQFLFLFEMSGNPRDLGRMLDNSGRYANIWVQLKRGDNTLMSSVIAQVEQYMAQNPPPHGAVANWAGLNYINVVWQEQMVGGMIVSLSSSFLIVLAMMIALFRSFKWGLLAMLPLTVTVGLIYGIIGLIGKDYDMPVAVLSSLALGIAVDFAIHYIERYRSMREQGVGRTAALEEMAKAPSRAIFRNVTVISVGFFPLLLAPLVPYITVGVLLAAIMLVSGIGTLQLLPATIEAMND